jgi:PAS domain S-box-containing protein
MSDSEHSTRVQQLESELKSSQDHLQIITSIASAATEPWTPGHITRRAIEIIVKSNDWAIGQYWTVDSKAEVLGCSDFVFSPAALIDFRTASLDRRFSRGVGLPGRVWANNLPLLLPDLSAEKHVSFPRRDVAVKSGLKSGFGFSAKSGPFVRGVFEFFSFDSIKVTAADMWFYDKLGVYIGTIMAQEDSTEALRRKEVWYRAVVNHAYNAFIGITEASQITDWSDRATTLFGWEKDEVLGKTIAEVIIPERYRQAHIQGLFRYMTTREGPILEKRIKAPALTKDGREIPIELFIFPIDTQNEKGFGAFIIDLSKPVPAEPEITLK